MSHPLVSVIVAIYNVERYLPLCLESILDQTYRGLEIILVDDGSSDSCPSICDSYARQDARIRVVHKSNGGLSSARNAGIDIAAGAYLSFIDGDDYIDSEFIGSLVGRAEAQQADMVVCGFTTVDERGNTLATSSLGTQTLGQDEYWSHYFVPESSRIPDNAIVAVTAWNKLYRRDLFAQTRYRVGKLFEDEFIICDLVAQCQRIAILDKPLYYYVQRTGSIMNSKHGLRYLEQAESNFTKCRHFIDRGKYRWACSALLRSIGGFKLASEAILNHPTSVAFTNAHATYRNLYRQLRPHSHSSELLTSGALFYHFPTVYLRLWHAMTSVPR